MALCGAPRGASQRAAQTPAFRLRLRINRWPVWGSLRAGAVPVWCCQFGAKGKA